VAAADNRRQRRCACRVYGRTRAARCWCVHAWAPWRHPKRESPVPVPRTRATNSSCQWWHHPGFIHMFFWKHGNHPGKERQRASPRRSRNRDSGSAGRACSATCTRMLSVTRRLAAPSKVLARKNRNVRLRKVRLRIRIQRLAVGQVCKRFRHRSSGMAGRDLSGRTGCAMSTCENAASALCRAGGQWRDACQSPPTADRADWIPYSSLA